jgi:hypothetical protein
MLVLTLVADTFPRAPLGTDLDSSWAAVLEYAAQHHLQYGKEIVFTYGPLGFLTTSRTIPGPGITRTIVDLGLCFITSAGICLLAWRMSILWRVLLLAALALVSANGHFGTSELLINLGLFSWALLCLLEESPRGALFGVVLALLAAFAVLVKFSCLVTAVMTIGAVICDLVLRKRPWIATATAGLFGSGVLILWTALGQDWGNLGAYLLNGWAVASGYDQAMGTAKLISPAALLGCLTILTSVLGTISVRALNWAHSGSRMGRWRRWLLWLWLCGLLFLFWKHGLVLADGYHVRFFVFFAVVLILGLESVPAGNRVRTEWARGLTAVGCVCAALTIQQMFFPGYLLYLVQHTIRMPGQRLALLLNADKFWGKIRAQQETAQRNAQLPRLRALVGDATVDLFGHNQAFVLINHFNYRPRPVFQSYAAYTPRLIGINEDFYLSRRAPDFVLFRLDPFPSRLPALEDSAALRHLLINYHPVEAEGSYLLLEKTRPQPQPASLSLLREGTVPLGKPVPVPDSEDLDCWLEIDVKPTLLGRARKFFYRSPDLKVKLWSDDPAEDGKEFLAPGGMLASGFLANPFLQGTPDVVDVYLGQATNRVTAYSIEVGAANKHFWQENLSYRLYKVENRLARCSPAAVSRLKYPGFGLPPAEVVSPGTDLVFAEGMTRLTCGRMQFYPVDVVTKSNVLLQLENQAALVVRPGGFAKFTVPAGATRFSGGYGFIHSASQGPGVEFAVEEALPDGSIKLLHSRTLNPAGEPADKGLHRFEVALSGDRPHQIFLRTRSAVTANGSSDLTGWACIGYE